MRLSAYFLPLLKENPAEAAVVSHKLMLRAGMIRQLSSGMYSWLPLGLAALRKVERVVREECERAGAVEVETPSVQPASLWQESGRYEAYGKEMLRVTDRHDVPMLFGPTAEEVMTDIFRKNVHSRRQLPLNIYQITRKFRDEVRPRFGVMRGREFLMKDGYSFDENEEGARATYFAMFRCYVRIFRRLGLRAVPVRADNGAIGGDLSHEFHVLADTGESAVYYDSAMEPFLSAGESDNPDALLNFYTAADEMHVPETCPVPLENVVARRGIEVGHIFNFGEKYTRAMNVTLQGADGKPFYPVMGSYGIGVTRLVAAVIEANHDERGIIWPEGASPFDAAVINIRPSDAECTKAAEGLYAKLTAQGLNVLYDDTDDSAGKKFAAMDLIGLPVQYRVGPKKAAEGLAERVVRATGETTDVAL